MPEFNEDENKIRWNQKSKCYSFILNQSDEISVGKNLFLTLGEEEERETILV